jgi:hypothetical protein
VELLQGGAGVEAEFAGEAGAGVVVGVEGLGGAAGAVEGEHVQLDEAFAGAVFGGEPGQFGQQRAVAAEVQAGGEGFLNSVQAEFVEVGAQPSAEFVGGGLVEGRAVPECEGVVEQLLAVGQVGGVGGTARTTL